MESTTGAAKEFQDIQKNKQELLVTKYLPEDLLKNWETIFYTRTFNPEYSFVELPSYHQARKNLWYNGWVTLCGYPGDGKSCTAEHLACSFVRGPETCPEDRSYSGHRTENVHLKLHFKQNSIPDAGRELYEIVSVSSPMEYVAAKVQANKKQVVIIDDIFGKGAFSWSKMEAWQPYLNELMMKLTNTRPNTLLILCVNKVHLEQAPEEISQLELFREGVMIDFTGLHKPSIQDKKDMMKKTASQGLFYSSELNDTGYANAHENVGLLYRFFAQMKQFVMQGNSFFQSPWRFCETAIDKVYSFDRTLYYTMAVAVVLDGSLDLQRSSLEEHDTRSQHVMKELISVLNVPADVDLAKMRYAATLLNGFFLRPVDKHKWVVAHDKIFQLCAASLCRKDSTKMLELFSTSFVKLFIRLGSLIGDNNELVVTIFPAAYSSLAQRMSLELLQGDMKEMIKHAAFAEERFVNVWFDQLENTATTEAIVQMKDDTLHRSLFYWACFYGQGPVVKNILRAGSLAGLRQEEEFRREMKWGLQAACALYTPGSAIAVKCLLDAGVPVNAREKYEGPNALTLFGKQMCHFMKIDAYPIHIAARRGHPESLKHLIAKGASLVETTVDGRTPLHWAAMRKYGDAVRAVRVLIDNKADINAMTHLRRKPLHEAFISGCLRTIETFVDAGADLHDTMDDKRSFHAMAAMNRHQDVGEYLFRKDIPLNMPLLQEPHPPIHFAINNRDLSYVELLLRKGADVNQKASSGLNPLHLACFLGFKEIVEVLLENGADVNMKANDRKTALHFAAVKGQFEIAEMLLEKGASTEIMTNKHETPLVLAARGNHKMVTWLLLREGVELESRGSDNF